MLVLGGPFCTMLPCSPASSSCVCGNSKTFRPGLEGLLEEAVERMVMGVSPREGKEKRMRRWRGADGGTAMESFVGGGGRGPC
jgi:hypothetical protein